MFGNIPEIITVVVIASALTLFWMCCTQWSRFIMHQKSDASASPEKQDLASRFAFIPYFLIPLIGVVGSVFCGMALGDYLAAHSIAVGAQEIAVVCVGASVIIYMAADRYLLKSLEDSTYYDTIESAALKSAGESAESIDSEDLKALKTLLTAIRNTK